MLNDLSEIIKIKSILSTPAPGAPFGKGNREALDWFLAKAKSYGLNVGESEGYCGWAEYCYSDGAISADGAISDYSKNSIKGKNSNHGGKNGLIGILCHLDVVPVGDGWSHPPFTLVNEDGYLYGRGVVDDKGSAVVALHVLKSLKENNVKLKNRVRLIVGLNEENGSACMKHYHEHCELPRFNIVPDSDFPIINSEKGIAHISISFEADEFFTENILSINCGLRPNIVPDYCKVEIKADSVLSQNINKFISETADSNLFSNATIVSTLVQDFCRPQDFSCHIFPDKTVLESRGISAHSMAPEKGENAFWKMATLLGALKGTLKTRNLDFAKEYLATPLAAERLGIDAYDDVSGALTINVGIVNYTNNSLQITLDLRLPICLGIDEALKKICDKAETICGAKTILDSFSPNLFIDKNSPLIKTLLNAYTKATGLEEYCVQSGGGTYARELPNSVAFGPTFPGAVTNIHNIDECISVEQFFKLFDIYYLAVQELDKL